jgi:ATP-dependent protease Clp ATPase subunit
MPRTDTHELVFCSFCGKSQHEVGTLIEGGCRNPALSQCVFICDECVALSAQVIADTVGKAKEAHVS